MSEIMLWLCQGIKFAIESCSQSSLVGAAEQLVSIHTCILQDTVIALFHGLFNLKFRLTMINIIPVWSGVGVTVTRLRG